MDKIVLTENLFLKKVDNREEEDMAFLSLLEKEEGVLEYLYELHSLINSSSKELWNQSYLIYYQEKAIGFLEISNLFYTKDKCFVTLEYALLEKQRGKGLMRQVVLEVCSLIFQERVCFVDEIDLCIDFENKQGQRLAEKSLFLPDGLTEEEHERQGFIQYYKRRI